MHPEGESQGEPLQSGRIVAYNGSGTTPDGGMQKVRNRLLAWGMLALLLAGWLYIACHVPYTYDDWDWGLEEGLERWWSGELNNRYAGTFFVLLMTRSPLAKTVVMAGAMTLIPLLLGLLASRGRFWERGFSLTLLSAGLLLATPMYSWQQSFGWVSAFANFVTAAVFLLLILLLWQRSFGPGASRQGEGRRAALLAPLCFMAQFFAENLTLTLLCAAVVCAVWSLRTGQGRLPALWSLAGCALGAALMFCNPLYGELLSSGEAVGGVRDLIVSPAAGWTGLLAAAGARLFGEVLPWLFESFPGATALACAGCLRQLWTRSTPRPVLALVGLWMGYFCVRNWIYLDQLRVWGTWNLAWPLLRGPEALLQLGLMVVILASARNPRRTAWLLILLAAVGLLVPFALIRDSGARCAFLSAVCLLALGTALLSDLSWRPWMTGAAAVLLAAGLIFHIQVYAVIGRSEAIRQAQMEQAVAQGADQVVLPTEGWEYCYCWQRNPSEFRAGYFRRFYGLPADMELVFLPRGSSELWPDVPKSMWAGAVRFPGAESPANFSAALEQEPESVL